MDDKLKCPKCGSDQLVRHVFGRADWHTCADCEFDGHNTSFLYELVATRVAALESENIQLKIERLKPIDESLKVIQDELWCIHPIAVPEREHQRQAGKHDMLIAVLERLKEIRDKYALLKNTEPVTERGILTAADREIADLKRLIRWAWELRTGARKPDIQDPQYSLNLVLFNQVAQEFKEG